MMCKKDLIVIGKKLEDYKDSIYALYDNHLYKLPYWGINTLYRDVINSRIREEPLVYNRICFLPDSCNVKEYFYNISKHYYKEPLSCCDILLLEKWELVLKESSIELGSFCHLVRKYNHRIIGLKTFINVENRNFLFSINTRSNFTKKIVSRFELMDI